MKILAAGGAAVAVVAVVAVAGTVIGNHRDTFSRGMKVETAAASLETTEAASESTGERNIVLETTLSAEEIASKEYEKTVQSIVDSYANLGIAEVSGYLNVRKTPESFGEVIGKLPKGGACEMNRRHRPSSSSASDGNAAIHVLGLCSWAYSSCSESSIHSISRDSDSSATACNRPLILPRPS